MLSTLNVCTPRYPTSDPKEINLEKCVYTGRGGKGRTSTYNNEGKNNIDAAGHESSKLIIIMGIQTFINMGWCS